MNGNASFSQYIYSHSGSTVVKVLACYDSSWFDPSERQGMSLLFFLYMLFFNVQTALWIFMINTLLPNNYKCFNHTV